MQITVDEYWWNGLVKAVATLSDRQAKLSEYGALLACGNVVVAARAVVDSASKFDEQSGNHEPLDVV